MNKLLLFILSLFWKGVNDVAVIYAALIIKGKKNFDDVPERIKDQVAQVLIDLDCGDLVANG